MNEFKKPAAIATRARTATDPSRPSPVGTTTPKTVAIAGTNPPNTPIANINTPNTNSNVVTMLFVVSRTVLAILSNHLPQPEAEFEGLVKFYHYKDIKTVTE